MVSHRALSRTQPARGLRLCLSLALVCVALLSNAATARQSSPPRFGLAYWQPMPGPMRLPVFDGSAIELGQHLVVLGGFTRELEASRAIQIRSPIDGWRPIGSALREPRARAELFRLPSRRVLVLGGYSGTWGRDAIARDDGETLDPLVAGSGRDVEPFGEALEGHAATQLDDGRVIVTCGCTLRVFDPAAEAWSAPIELSRERHHHSMVRTERTITLIGGDDAGTIESFAIDAVLDGSATSELWEASFGDAISHTAAIALDGRHLYVAGGYLPDERTTVSTTWTIDVAKRSLRPSVDLPAPRGVCDATLVRHPRGVLILDGEWRSSAQRGNANCSYLLAGLLDDRGLVRGTGARQSTPELWTLPKFSPTGDLARRMLVRCADGSIEAIGGYRYRSPDLGVEGSEDAGVTVDGTGQRLVVEVQPIAD